MKALWIALVLFAAFSRATVEATIMLKRFSVDELTGFSDSIIQGTVKSVEYQRTEKKQIYTLITVSCDQTYKGGEKRDITIIQEGGKTDTYTTAVYGAPMYDIEEEIIVFLKNLSETQPLNRVVALSQGKYSIVTDENTGEQFAVSDSRDIHFIEDTGLHNHGHAENVTKIPVEELIASIKQAVAAEEAAENTQPSDQQEDLSGMAAETSFDWIRWIRRKIIYYANQCGHYYARIKKDTIK